MGKWTKQAKLALSQRNYTQAGDFFKLDGDYRAAIKAYTNGKNFSQAARLYEDMGKIDKAEKLLTKQGSPKDVAEFHIRHNNHERATQVYINANMHYEAAELLEKLNHLARAAALYENLGFHERAGVLYGKSKNFDKAIAMFTKVIESLDANTAPMVKSKILKYRTWIANFHIGAKRYIQAGEIFELSQQKEKAARCYNKGGEAVRAARILLDLHKLDDALEILNGVNSLESRVLQGKIFHKKGKFEEAVDLLKDTDEAQILAECYEHLGDFQKAAFQQEKVGNLKNAADMYAKARDHQKAAILYEQNGYYEDAAINYEAQKKYGNAAKLYHLAKNRYKAGHCLFLLKRLEDALAQLQTIPEDHETYPKAKALMAEIFYKQGVFSVARGLFEEILSEVHINDQNMLEYYYLARCHEEEGNYMDAKRIYERVAARKYNFHDVTQRLRRLQGVKPTNEGSINTVTVKNVASPSDLSIGDVIDNRFKVLDTIGKGGMGAIFRVMDMELNRKIALKMLTHKRGDFEELKVELLIARDLTHPYIIKVFDVGQWNKMGYFTMEAVDGIPLKTYIHNSEGDSLEFKIQLLIKICEGLKAAHDMNVVHRDIKPQNIMIDRDQNPKILDFGIARKTTHNAQGKPISGSPKYMAPEQIRNVAIDVRTDIYAMGIIMFYMFTLKEPFLAKTPQAVMKMHLDTPMPDPMSRNPMIPYWLSEIILKCGRKEPGMRFMDMGELIDELKLNLLDF